MANGEVEYVGPFTSHRVVINERAVPYLIATPVQGGRVLTIG